MVDVNVDFTLSEDEPINADFTVQPDVEYTADITLETGTRDHDKLDNRNLPDQHPMSAITGLETALDGKQDTLTAGDNIQIENGVISATDTTYTAGDGISIENGVISNTQTSAEWGNITGTLSDQTDLNNALGDLSGGIDSNHQAISNHVSDKNNPHEVTKAQVGLGNVDNTSDLNKPISTATQTALNDKADKATTYTKTEVDNALSGKQDNLSTAQLSAVNSGIDSTKVAQIATNTNDISSLQSNKADKATTLAGYGITDAYTKTEVDTALSGKQNNLDTTQMAAVNSGANTTNIGQIATNTSDIGTINGKIPSAASSSNQLADKSYVDTADNNLQSQIDAITAASDVTDIVGTYAELQAYDTSSLPNNSIIKVLQDESRDDETTYYRWVITGGVGSWVLIGEEGPYYTKSETDTLLQAKQNEITSSNKLSADLVDDTSSTNKFVTAGDISTWNAKQNALTAGTGIDITSDTISNSGVRSVSTGATNGTISVNTNGTSAEVAVYGLGSAAYTASSAYDASGAASTAETNAKNYADSLASNYATAAQGALADTALQSGDNISELNNNAGYITGITSSDVTSALGYTPYNSSNPSGYQANVIETVKVNGTALTPTNKAVDVSVPTKTSDLNNDDGFITGITSSDVTTALGYTPYDSSNPSGYTDNVGTVTSVNNTQPDSNGNVTLSIPAAQVNSDWDAVSGVAQILNKPTIPTVNNATLTITQGGTTKGTFTANASSDVTIALDAGGGSSYTAGTGIDITNDVISVASPTLINRANNTSDLTICPNSTFAHPATANNSAINIGEDSESLRYHAVAVGGGSKAYSGNSVALGYGAIAGNLLQQNTTGYAIAIGYSAKAKNENSIAIGRLAVATGDSSIQIGYGTNSEANSFYVATSSSNNWKMLGSDGLIPDARISSNIARTSAIPTVNNATLTITQGGTTKGTFTANASSNVTIDLDSGADTDGDTINTNLNNELQAIGLINQRDGNAIKIWQGTSSQWTNGEATTWYYWQTNVTGGWTSGTIPTSDTWLGMAYGSNRFVIVSGQKKSAYSTDGGETWTTGGNLPNGATSVAYGDGTFVAVMPFSRKTSYSTDGGETWTTGGNLPFSPSFGNNFAFGNGVFVCVDYSRIAYSTNHGVSWSSISLSNNPSYIGFDGEYFILTGGGFDTSYYSQDGVSWSQGGNLPSSGGWDINYNIDNKYVVVSSNGGLTAYTTDHGVTWTEGTSIPYNIGDIACSNNVIVGIYTATSSTNSYYSIDGGETWTASTMQDNQEWRKLAVDNNGKFVAVGVSDKSNSFSIDYQKCYTDTANPTTTSTVYSAPETTSGYTITGASSGAITLSDNNTYYYNQSGNQYTYQSVGTAHPNWLCFINNVGVKIGNTTIATNNSNS